MAKDRKWRREFAEMPSSANVSSSSSPAAEAEIETRHAKRHHLRSRISLSPSGAKCGYFRQDGRTDGLSDWLDDNEAASGDFAAELIFYSRLLRHPPTPFLLGWRLRARDRWAANLGLGIRITASAKNGGCREGVSWENFLMVHWRSNFAL